MSYENPDLEDYKFICNVFASVYERMRKAKTFEEREEFYQRLSSYNLIYWKYRRAVDQKGLIDLDGKPITSLVPEGDGNRKKENLNKGMLSNHKKQV